MHDLSGDIRIQRWIPRKTSASRIPGPMLVRLLCKLDLRAWMVVEPHPAGHVDIALLRPDALGRGRLEDILNVFPEDPLLVAVHAGGKTSTLRVQVELDHFLDETVRESGVLGHDDA